MSFISATIFGLVVKEPEIHITPAGKRSLRVWLGVPMYKQVEGKTMCFIETITTNSVIINRIQEMGLEKGDYAVSWGQMIMDCYKGSWYPKFFCTDIQIAQAFKPKEKKPSYFDGGSVGQTVKLNQEYKDNINDDFDW